MALATAYQKHRTVRSGQRNVYSGPTNREKVAEGSNVLASTPLPGGISKRSLTFPKQIPFPKLLSGGVKGKGVNFGASDPYP
jgi:hypothetical protein